MDITFLKMNNWLRMMIEDRGTIIGVNTFAEDLAIELDTYM